MRLRDKLIIAGGVLVIGLVSWWVLRATWPAPEIVVSKETTWLTEPLADDGLPDYAGYLLARAKEGATPENNGAIPFLRAMWPAELEPGEQQRVVCEEVGMEVPHSTGIPYYGRDPKFTRPFESWLSSLPPRGADETPLGDLAAGSEIDVTPWIAWSQEHNWSTQDFPPLAAWVEAYEAQRLLLLEAASRPRFFAPSPSWIEAPNTCAYNWLLPMEQSIASAGKYLNLHARLALGERNLDAAVKDWEALQGLARHVPRDFIIGRRISTALSERAGELCLSILDHPQLTAPIARRVLKGIKSQPDLESIATSLDESERIALLTFILGISQIRPDPEDLKSSLPAGQKLFEETSVVDWNVPLRLANGWYDRLVAAARIDNWQERTEAFQQISDDLKELTTQFSEDRIENAISAAISRGVHSELLGQVLVSLLLPEFQNVSAEIDRANANRQLHAVAAALALFRLEHEEYPQQLEALIPELLTAAPVDLYRTKPLVYRRMKEGYILYSCGPNGNDNRGSNVSEGVLEGYDVELVDLEATRENENHLRELLGQPALGEGDGEDSMLVDEIPVGSDDIAIRLPLPRLKLPPLTSN